MFPPSLAEKFQALLFTIFLHFPQNRYLLDVRGGGEAQLGARNWSFHSSQFYYREHSFFAVCVKFFLKMSVSGFAQFK
jgi:hypothetical protein